MQPSQDSPRGGIYPFQKFQRKFDSCLECNKIPQNRLLYHYNSGFGDFIDEKSLFYLNQVEFKSTK